MQLQVLFGALNGVLGGHFRQNLKYSASQDRHAPANPNAALRSVGSHRWLPAAPAGRGTMTPMLRGMRGIAPLQVRAGSGALFAPLPNQGSFLSRCKCLRLESTRPTDDACTFIPLSSPVLATCRDKPDERSMAGRQQARPVLSRWAGHSEASEEGRGAEEGDCVTAPSVSVCSLQLAACSLQLL